MPYTKGKSGNPNGRPKGSKDKRTLLFQQLVPHGGKLVQKAVALALDNDPAMLALCINKLIPNPKPVDRPVAVKGLTGTLTERGDKVINATAKGEITPAEAQILLGALASQAKLQEIDELTQRIEALERGATD